MKEPPATTRVLCVDLDGCLVATDTAYEALVALLRRRPWSLPVVLLWRLKGLAHLKHRLAEHAPIDVSALPYRQCVIQLIDQARASGSRVLLVTAADRQVAQAVADQLGLFDHVLASDGQVNLKGAEKVRAIREHVGEASWAYAGDSRADLVVWRRADDAILVAPTPRTRKAALAYKPNAVQLAEREPLVRGAWRSLRCHQWSKNLLLLIPLLAGHLWSVPNLILVAMAIVSMSLMASAVYLINDVLDIASDRVHPTKRRRPIASGALPIPWAMTLVLACLLMSLSVAWQGVGLPFLGMVSAYLVLTSAYSLLLKSKPILDVITLASLYTLRMVAGGVAIGIQVSHWLLVFSMFLFLSLAFAKRYAELHKARQRDVPSLHGRGYQAEDLHLLSVFGTVSGFLAILVFALYLNSSIVAELYREPLMLWMVCPVLLYWVSMVWLSAVRGQLHDDPVVFAIKEPRSYACMAVIVLLALAAGPL